MIIGRNAVIELLKSGREVENVLVAKGEREGSINRIIAMCRENKIVVKTVDRKNLILCVPAAIIRGLRLMFRLTAIQALRIFWNMQKQRRSAFIIICDEIEDSHNLGAIIRTAEACGAHGIIIPKRRNVGLNFIVAKPRAAHLNMLKLQG